jgi:hypothetical protein
LRPTRHCHERSVFGKGATSIASPAITEDRAVASSDSWTGWIVFAGFVLSIVGAIDALQGLVAIVKDDYVVATPKGVAIVDVTAWGWATLIWGVVLVLAGLGLLGGAGWARWLAIIGVAVNAIGQMAFMANYPQAYPLWNILIVALNIVVLYALTAHWRGFQELSSLIEDSDAARETRLVRALDPRTAPKFVRSI